MARVFFLLFIATMLNAQIVTNQKRPIGVANDTTLTLVKAIVEDTVTVYLEALGKQFRVNTATVTDNLRLIPNKQIMNDSSRGIVTGTVGDWIHEGDGYLESNGDSSFSYSTVPQELNPNLNFQNWSNGSPVGWAKGGPSNDENYIIESEKGFKIVSDANGTNINLWLYGIFEIGQEYVIKVVVDSLVGGGVKSQSGVSPYIAYTEVGTFIDTITAKGNSYNIGRYTSNTEVVVSEVSIRKFSDETFVFYNKELEKEKYYKFKLEHREGADEIQELNGTLMVVKIQA